MDLSSHSGFCVTYKSTKALNLRLGGDGYGEYNLYQATMPKASSWTAKDFAFSSSFSQESGWGTEVDLDSVLTNLVWSIEFEYSSSTQVTSSAELDILQVGWYGECSTE